jgi:tellurite resistance protein TerC
MRPSDRDPSEAWRIARKVAVAVLGTTVLAIGLALLVLPGPAVVVLPIGLAILATEFLWARKLLERVKQRLGSDSRPT